MPTPGPLEFLIIAGLALQLLLPVAAVLAIVYLWRRRARPGDVAMDALRKRLADGDIDDAEYERLRSVLQRH
jgi:uncharacterized membrane protein